MNQDRAVGAVLGMATGDALGAGYEFESAVLTGPIVFKPGIFAAGEWTDDTSMAIPILRALAEGHPLSDDATLDDIVGHWVTWSRTSPDVGTQIREVLGAVAHAPSAAAARIAARKLHERRGISGGNGSLMRTAPVALGFLGDDDEPALAAAARALSDLTHYDPTTGDACVLWSCAIRHAIRTGELDVLRGLGHIPAERSDYWTDLFREAASIQPHEAVENGWVIDAVRAAWSAISHSTSYADGVTRAVRCGNDTDTVAAIAGGLLGAVHGASAIPPEWTSVLRGWGAANAAELTDLARRALAAAG